MSSPRAEGDSRRYWKAVISTLPNVEKRDAAWEFYTKRLESGKAGDLLSALILLLEANGTFLLTLPERFHGDLIAPMVDRIAALQAEIQAHFERQQKALAAFDQVEDSVATAASLIQRVQGEMNEQLKASISGIDVAAIASRINRSLETDTLRPIQHALWNLDKHAERANRASEGAERSIAMWRKIHFGGIILTSILSALFCAAIAVGYGWWRIDRHYQQRIAAEVLRLSDTDEAYRNLLMFGVSLRLANWVDDSGRPVKDGKAVLIDDAVDTSIKTEGDTRRAVVLVKSGPLIKRLDAFIEKVETKSKK